MAKYAMLLADLFETLPRPMMAPTLYHGTSSYAAMKIIEANAIEARTEHSRRDLGMSGDGAVFGVSLSRSVKAAASFGQFIFALDSRSLRQRQRIVPIDYWSKELLSRHRFREEAEEFVVGTIGNLESSLLAIYIRQADMSQFYKQTNYTNPAFMHLFKHQKVKILMQNSGKVAV